MVNARSFVASKIFEGIRSGYLRFVIGKCTSRALLTDKTVLITGADKGIGYETALELARRKARVIMACRDMINAERVAKEIKNQTGNDQVFVRKIDVSSLSSVNEFAKNFVKDEKNLHVLINNAGIPNYSFSLKRTEEGFEKTFATNYLGHFLLTMLLLDLLKKNSPSRIINVSSFAHKLLPSFDVSNLNSEKYFSMSTYGITKLIQILFTKELSRQLEGTGVTVNCLHPGTVDTNLMNKFPQPIKLFAFFLKGFICRSAKDGAQTSIYLAVSEDLKDVSGCYFSECKQSTPSKWACDPHLARKVFEASEEYCSSYLDGKVAKE